MTFAVALLGIQVLLADTTTGSDIAPWATSGLAGLILGWLFLWHIPAKDKMTLDLVGAKDKLTVDLISAKDTQIGALIQSRDAIVERLISSRDVVLKENREDFKIALSTVVKHCEDEVSRQTEMAKQRDDRIDSALTDLREVLEQVRDGLRELKRGPC